MVPGKGAVVIPQADIRITNAALGDVIADANGRTVVKITYRKLVEVDSDDEEDDEAPPEEFSTTFLCSFTPGKVGLSIFSCYLIQLSSLTVRWNNVRRT